MMLSFFYDADVKRFGLEFVIGRKFSLRGDFAFLKGFLRNWVRRRWCFAW
jgi:hypothetical protein